MTKKEVKQLKIGSEFIDCIGAHKVIVDIRYHGNTPFYEIKWIMDENGTLSKGSEFNVPCHFNKWDKVIKY